MIEIITYTSYLYNKKPVRKWYHLENKIEQNANLTLKESRLVRSSKKQKEVGVKSMYSLKAMTPGHTLEWFLKHMWSR